MGLDEGVIGDGVITPIIDPAHHRHEADEDDRNDHGHRQETTQTEPVSAASGRTGDGAAGGIRSPKGAGPTGSHS